jgi:hypothetical protein
MTMRNVHRWLMTVFVIILAYWVCSGLIMAIYDATDPTQVWAIEGGGAGERLGDSFTKAASIPAPQTLASGISAALAAVGDMPVASVELRMVGTTARLQLAQASGERSTMRRFHADTGAPISADSDDGDASARAAPNVVRRNNLKAWHRGNVAGLPGQFIGLLAGLTLIVLSVTGIFVYFQLWNARRRTGRRAFFWSLRESLWRRLHRWVSIVAAAFVLNIAISGVILAYGEIWIHLALQYHIFAPPYPRPTPLPPVSAGPISGDVNAMLQRSYQAAAARNPTTRIVSVQLVQRDGLIKALVWLDDPQPITLALDAQTGLPVSDWSTGGLQLGNGYFADWHQVIKRIHRGDIVGRFSGRYIDLTFGLALLYLLTSSIAMYIDLLRRRRRLGRTTLFWT